MDSLKITPGFGTLSLKWTLPPDIYAAIVRWRDQGSDGPWEQILPPSTTEYKIYVSGLPVPTEVQIVMLPNGSILEGVGTPQ